MARTRDNKKKNRSTLAALNQQNSVPINSGVKKRQQKPKAKRVSWRDEQIQCMSVGEIDPAILCVREMIRYTKEELLDIAKHPASKCKPDFLDPNEVCVSILDPEKWNIERKKSDTPDTGSKGSESGENRRRPGDPRERIRKENDGIVLSPQRRSFNSGCFVPANKESIGGKGEAPPHLMGAREIPSSTRRIGSGRIMRDSWENDKELGEPDFSFGRGVQNRNNERDRGDDKYGDRGGPRDDKYGDRRSYGREIDGGSKEKERDGRRNGRYTENRRRYSENKEDEPEWFSSGPMSQNDTIELRGFDESDKPGKRKMTAARVKRVKDWSKKKENTIAEEDKEKGGEDAPKGGSTHNNSELGPPKENNKPEQGNERDRAPPEPDRKAPDQNKMQNDEATCGFDFDEFLKGETIPGLLPNGGGDEGPKSTSRFSRWFKKESPNKEVGTSRKSSFQEDNHIIKDLLKDITEQGSVPVTVHPPPMDSNTYFAPISPAGNSFGGVDGPVGDKARPNFNVGQPVSIMDLLARGKQGQQPEGWSGKGPAAPSVGSGKILSLDELEAKIRQNSDHSGSVPPKAPPQKPDEEMTAAFKRLLQQASGQVQNGPMNKPPGMSLLEMLNHSQQQDEARMVAAQAAQALAINPQHHPTPHHGHQQPQMHNDLMLKLQQAQLQQKQMDMLGKLMSSGGVPSAPHVRASPLLDMGVQQSRELLSRPEAQAILQGLKRGEITIQHLYQQIANPALQPRHREMLVTIVKLHGNSSYGPSPRVLSPVPITSHHLFPPQQQAQMQQQQLRVSPLPPNAMHQRIPSPRELQVHTQNILQRALIKKKLEEQTENFRKKQEMQRGTSPNITGAQGMNAGNQQGGGKGVSSPTPLAFTPTSVLRKMTADKDEGKENKAVTDNGMKPQGRPLTGIRSQPQVAVNSQQWNQAFPMKQAGRPIVKANNYQSQTPDQFFAQLASQQQQPLPPQRTYQNVPNPAHMKPIIGQQFPAQGSPYGPSQSQFSLPNPQPFPQPTAQQLRAQHQARPNNPNPQPATNQSQQEAQNQSQAAQKQHQMAQQTGTAAWQPYLNTMPGQTSRQAAHTRSVHQAGPLSPTTADQLTRWFSPDLLERARGGELPSTANLARLEEIERQAAPPVHN